jgi:hypothetical protein
VQLPLQLQQLVLQVELDATGAPLGMIAEMLANAPQLRRLELRPVHNEFAICCRRSSSDDGDKRAAALGRLLDTSTLRGLSALAFNGPPPALALFVAQHSNLRQLLSL